MAKELSKDTISTEPEGSWVWAIHQLIAGKKIRQKHWIACDHIKWFGRELLCEDNSYVCPSQIGFNSDWEICNN